MRVLLALAAVAAPLFGNGGAAEAAGPPRTAEQARSSAPERRRHQSWRSWRPSASTLRRVPKMGLRLPIVTQAHPYSCGAGALLSVLQYFEGYDYGESTLYRALKTTPEQGTHPTKIVEVARSFGLGAELKEGLTVRDLRRAVRAGKPVILDIQAWRDGDKRRSWKDNWEDGHYVVLKAVGTKYVYFMDPSAGPSYGYMPIPELLERWHDYELEPVAGKKRRRRREYRNMGIVIEGPKPRPLPGVLHVD